MSWLELYDHQRQAIDKMKNGCILCGGVGSGKSKTALAYYYKLNGGDIDSKRYSPLRAAPCDLYIITTALKRDKLEWNAELVPFLLSVHEEDNYYKNKVVVDSWNNIGKYVDVQGAFFIFDEQRVVGYGAWTHSFLKIVKNNRWILLTATPGDKWIDYMPVFIANGFYKNKTDFEHQHVVYSWNRKFKQIDRYTGIGQLIRQRRYILVNMEFERTTTSHHEDIITEYDKTLYKQITRTRWDPWKNEPIINASEYCQLVRKVSNTDESRQVALLQIFEKHPKLIIFYNFDYELDILKNLYYGEDVEIAEWNGHKHQDIPRSKSWIYLVNYNAGAEGWNCILTDTIVFYSQTYSYRTLVQAEGRINRINTPFTDLYYYHIRCRSPIDIAIHRALCEKKEFNEGRFYKQTTEK